ncbi:MAG TPA: peptidoglycan-binding protein [Opitutae bacterium]|nr:peptidoglycan-binding protein [Opitutae bacterium]
MSKSYFPVLLCLSTLCSFSPVVFAQSDNIRVTVANLSQDVSLLTQQVKTMRLELEELQRENARLRAQAAAASGDYPTQAQISRLSAAVESLRREYRAADEVQKQQIIAEVTRQINALAKETQGAINTVAQAFDSQPQVAASVHFSDDYPKTGRPYVVRAGDTLSAIARSHGSTVKDIQNANKIVNPARDLKVGETIFIPIAQ